MRHSRTILAAIITLLVVACSGPPPAPQVEAVSPQVAPRGDAITITGTNFGSDGTVTVGGAAATVSDWTASSIEVVVPDTAPNAWQPVTVTTSNGEATLDEFFVGVEFDGTATDLQDFLDAQDEGIAVLLQAEEYAFGTGNLLVDGRDLYGRGRDVTTLSFDDAVTSGIHVQPGADSPATAADMEIVTSQLVLGRGVTITAPRHGPQDDALTSQAAGTADLTLSGLNVMDAGTTGTLFNDNLLTSGQEMLIEDTTIALATFALQFDGELKLEGVKVDNATDLVADVSSGSISVLDSDLMIDGDIRLYGAGGITIESSTVAANDGDLELNGVSAIPDTPGGPIVVIESVLEALDGDLTDLTTLGRLEIFTQNANVTLDGNERILGHAGVTMYVDGTMPIDVQITGNQELSAGFAVDGERARSANIYFELDVGSSQPGKVTVHDNVFMATQDLEFYSIHRQDADFTENRFVAGNESDSGWVALYFYEDTTLEIAGNEFDVWGGSVQIGGALEASLDLTSNTFGGTEVEHGIVIWDFGTTTMSKNTFTPTDAQASSFALRVISMFESLQLSASENTFTGFENGFLVWDDFGAGTVFDVAVNGNTFDSEFAPTSRVVELRAVGQIVDATDNQWGSHTDVSVVENLVHLDPDTVTLGGDVDLAPIRVP